MFHGLKLDCLHHVRLESVFSKVHHSKYHWPAKIEAIDIPAAWRCWVDVAKRHSPYQRRAQHVVKSPAAAVVALITNSASVATG